MALNFDDSISLFNFVVRDGNGVKGMVDLNLTKVPQLFIQPRKERIDMLGSRPYDQPPIDLSMLDGPQRDQVTQQIALAAEQFGFFQVVNHGVPIEILESLKEAANWFFGQPREKKAVYRKDVSPTPLVQYATSFAPEKEKTLEWRDLMSMKYTNEAEALQYWPKEIGHVALEYLKISTNMVKKLMEVLIGNLGVTLDDEKLDSLICPKAVNVNFYPACPNPELTVGVGSHSDMGTLTVLLQDEIGGLCVKVEEDVGFAKKGEWVEIPSIPGALIINVGDTLQILSNGKYKSAEHRVRTTSRSSRVSIPLFVTPKLTEKIAPLPEMIEKDGMARYREVLFGDYFMNYFANKHNGKRSLDFAEIKHD